MPWSTWKLTFRSSITQTFACFRPCLADVPGSGLFFLKRVGMITGEDAYIPSQDVSQDLMQAQFVNPAFWLWKYQKLPTNILLDTLFSTS